jgi:hypothetical protein
MTDREPVSPELTPTEPIDITELRVIMSTSPQR